MRSVCSVDGCSSIVKGRGLCNKHLLRLKLTGTTDPGPKAEAPIEERFWRQVDKRSDDKCWEWIGYKLPNGYGRISVGTKAEGSVTAHRFSCRMHHGEPPYEGAHVMHLCDNRACVNPAHIRWATPAENIQDAYDKGRKVSPFRKGAAHHQARLNEEQVRFIKANPDMRQAQLARLLGCSRTAIAAIREGRTWKHVS